MRNPLTEQIIAAAIEMDRREWWMAFSESLFDLCVLCG